MTLNAARHIHIIGIGGIGVSAIAKWLLEQGKAVSGTDLHANPNTEWLSTHGADVRIGGHASAYLGEKCDLVVRTVAVPQDNPEYLAAMERNIPVLSYPEALGQLLAQKTGIAIAGSHGKSTTTALLAYILVEAQLDPTVIVGTRVQLFGDTNERIGTGEHMLIEADEYNQGILLYHPRHATVLNVDFEHVDVYPTFTELQKAFCAFIEHVPADGVISLNADDPSLPLLQKAAKAKVHTFSLQQGDISAAKVTVTIRGQTLDVRGLYNASFTTQLFGEHNVRNILAALCVAYGLGIAQEVCQKAVAAFPGTWRRFENRGAWRGATIIDDYAHHPTEIQATLQAARQAFPGRRVLCVFQPHLRSRTAAFATEFAAVLQHADACVILEVYDPAGRSSTESISSKSIVLAIGNKALYAKDVPDAVQVAGTLVQEGDVVLTLGAGDVTAFAVVAQKENPNG